jgi:hypothetical protein
MGDLLALAVVAHGGMQRWDEFKTLRTVLSVAGSLLLTGKIFEIKTRDDPGASFAGQTLETPSDQDAACQDLVWSEPVNRSSTNPPFARPSGRRQLCPAPAPCPVGQRKT